jgi:hypothetical protein
VKHPDPDFTHSSIDQDQEQDHEQEGHGPPHDIAADLA